MHALPANQSPVERRLLIAEDDPNTLFPLREYFCYQGYTVDCVVGPIEARRMLDRFPYSVLLTDLHLTADRGSEGLMLVEQARLRQPEIRTILMTAFPSSQTEFDALRLGADLVLAKPVALMTLQDAVNGKGT